MQGERDVDQLLGEHRALMRAHAQAQARCSALLREQAEAMRRMEAQLMRTRAALVRSETMLNWEREERAELVRSLPGLGRRVALARQVQTLQDRVRALMDELQRRSAPFDAAGDAHLVSAPDAGIASEPAALDAMLEAADLVICRTGCLSHGDYWRVHDHCKRTGKVCVMVEQADGAKLVRIHRNEDAPGEALTERR